MLPLASLIVLAAAQATSADSPGKAVYEQYCAACHNQPENTRAPALSALQKMSAQTIRFALTEGIMRQQGSAVPREQFQQLISYVAAAETTSGDWVAGMMCKPDQRAIDLNPPISMSMYGTDPRNSRRLSAQQAGLTSKDLGNLELAWAIAFPKTASLRTSAAIIGSTMFYSPVQTGKVLALDTRSACVKWAYDAGVPLRSSLSYGELGSTGKMALVFGDAR